MSGFTMNIHGKAKGAEIEQVRTSIAQLEKELAAEKKRLASLNAEGGAVASAKGEKPAKEGKQKGEKPAKDAKKEEEGGKFVLTNAQMGKVCTRFPPEASGFMHIGHAKAGLTNFLLAKKYNGRMVFRFDDTNPKKEDTNFEKSIVEDCKRLGIEIERITYTSERFEEFLELATKMLKEGKAYCDDTDKETIQKQRMDGIASKCREQTVEENMKVWEGMQAGTRADAVLRAKMSVDDPNKCLRDPVLYRVVLEPPHPHSGDKYKVYPTYDFACPIVDSLDGVTHALRTSEYNDRNPQYNWICDALGLRKPHIEDFSRLNMEYTVMSKRKLTKFVEDGLVTGWDDPRFPTVKGVLRRGLCVEALKQFIVSQGMSRANNFQDWAQVWNINRNVIDPNEGSTCKRFTCVAQDGKVPVTISNVPEKEETKKPYHKKNVALGDKAYFKSKVVYVEEEDMVLCGDNEEVTLMDWGNIILESVTRTEGGKRVTAATARFNPEGDFKKTKKLSWIANVAENNVKVELQEYEYLITALKVDPDTDIEKITNRDSKGVTFALGEQACKEIKKGDYVQFERRGYYICDAVKPHLVMVNVPDGKTKVNHLSYYAVRKRMAGETVQAVAAKEDKKDERNLSLEERRAKKKAVKDQSAGAAKGGNKAKKELDASNLDIRVGKIVEIGNHPDADSLFVEKIDCGEGAPRTVVSGLRNYYKPEDLDGKLVAVLCNLKPAPMRGIESCGMVLCASPAGEKTTVDVLKVPEGAKAGERVTFPGFPAPETIEEIPKKKKDGLIEPLNTDANGVARWGEAPFTTSAGPITSTLKSGLVR